MTTKEPVKNTNETEITKQLFRVQFEITPRQLERIEELILKFPSAINSKRELVNSAVSLLAWAVTEKEKGRAIGSINEKRTRFFPLLFPPLEDIEVKDNNDEDTIHNLSVG